METFNLIIKSYPLKFETFSQDRCRAHIRCMSTCYAEARTEKATHTYTCMYTYMRHSIRRDAEEIVV